MYNTALLVHALALSSAYAAAARPTVSLDGSWEFSLDPQRQGWAAGWSSGNQSLPHRCPVPGAWEAAGYGNATDRLWHSYTVGNKTLDELFPTGGYNTPLGGLAWYRTTVTPPAGGSGQHLFLRVGGVHRSVTAFANGERLGQHTGYLHELEWDITKAVGGKSSLALVLAVDSFHNNTVDPLMGCFDMGEEPELNNPVGGAGSNPPLVGLAGPWGGIWGHVTLETRGTCWLSDLFVHATNRTVVASANISGPSSAVGSVRLDIVDCATAATVASNTVPLPNALDIASGRLSVSATMPDDKLKLWSPDSPALYNATISLLPAAAPGDATFAAATDTIGTRFGVKDLKIEGPSFVLNGKKLFLSGFGIDAPYADTIAAPSDKAYHLRQARIAKSFGFNFVRCHSHFLPPEYYDAMDEVGILVSPELPIVYQQYLSATGDTGLAEFKSSWVAAIKRHRNHPSIFDWGGGNEHIWTPRLTKLMNELYRLAKALDPTRPMIASDGNLGYPSGQTNPVIDFYSVDGTPWLGDPPVPTKPVISHETGNFNTFPRLVKSISDLTPPGKASKFLKPFWLTHAHERLKSTGMIYENSLWSLRSEQLYVFTWKKLIESIRASPYMSGHEWWCFAEFWMAGNGIVDYAFDLKPGVSPLAVRSYIGDLVLLLDAPGADSGLSPAFVSKETLNANLSLSNYGAAHMPADHIKWEVDVDGTTICSGSGNSSRVAEQGSVSIVATISCQLPGLGTYPAATVANTKAPQLVVLRARLENDDGSLMTNNSWTSRLYPEFKDSPSPVPYYVSSEALLQQCMFNNAKYIPVGNAVESNAVILADSLTDHVLAALDQNATVLLVAGTDMQTSLIPTAPNKFDSCWWLGSPSDSNVGTVVYPDHGGTLDGLDDSGWCDGTWQRMIDGSVTFIMDPVNSSVHEHIGNAFHHDSTTVWDPTGAKIHIRALDYVLGGPRSKSLLFEVGGANEGGRLIATGLNLLQTFQANVTGGWVHPEKAYLLWRLLVDGMGIM